MDDNQIIDLYWARSENAITETANKYGPYCHTVAYNILKNNEDSEECVNDTYRKAWDAMPPQHPQILRAFLGKITRNLSLNRYDKRTAEKRGAGQVTLALEELSECLPAANHVEQIIDDMALAQLLNSFLATLPTDARKIFMRRYWYLNSVKEIAEIFSISESNVKTTLFRARNKLKLLLEKEGVAI